MEKVVKHGQSSCLRHYDRNYNHCGVMRQLALRCSLAVRKKGFLLKMQVNRIVKAAAKRVPGLEDAIADTVSPQWLRHAHASTCDGSRRSGSLG